jgi:hypothetical protein
VRHGLQGYADIIDLIITDVSSMAVEGSGSSMSAFQMHGSNIINEQDCSAI